MCPDDPKTCRRIRTAIKLFIHPDTVRVDRDLFLHSLPNPLPTDKPDILDLILQLILAFLEELKPDNGNGNGNGDTNFPHLGREAADLARQHVSAVILSETKDLLSDSIALTVHELTSHAPPSLRIARETMRRANHAALGPDVRSWNTWNDAIRQLLDGFAAHNRLNTLPTYLDAWTQISKGLQTIP